MMRPMPRTMNRLLVPTALALLFGSVACTAPQTVVPLTRSSARAVAASAAPADAGVKVFTLPNDWRIGPVVVAGGAEIEFRQDGTGELRARVHAPAAGTEVQSARIHAYQSGGDGLRLFMAPNNAQGFCFHLRAPRWQVVSTLPFGFDPALFPLISTVRFTGSAPDNAAAFTIPSRPLFATPAAP